MKPCFCVNIVLRCVIYKCFIWENHFLKNFIVSSCFLSDVHVNISTVTKIWAILWHLQEDLAPFRWRELGEIIRKSKLGLLFVLFFSLFRDCWTLTLWIQVCCDGCNVWVHAECDNISSKLFKVIIILICDLIFPLLSNVCLPQFMNAWRITDLFMVSRIWRTLITIAQIAKQSTITNHQLQKIASEK